MIVNDLRQIEALHHLARTQSFAETARLMSVTPSAISHSIKSLEHLLACTLVDRSTKPLSLTASGYQLISSTQTPLAQFREALEEVAGRQKSSSAPVVHIGIERALSDHILHKLIPQLNPRAKQTKFEFTVGQTSQLLGRLRTGELDYVAGLTPPSSELANIAHRSVFHTEELSLFLPQSHPAVIENTVDWKAQQSVISLSYDSYDRDLIESYFYQLQIEVEVHHHVNSQEAFYQLVSSGMGIGIGSKWMMERYLADRRIAFLPLSENQLIRRWSLFSVKKKISAEFSALFSSLLR